MEWTTLLDMVLHIDKSLDSLLGAYGPLVYAVLFAIVFAETGLVIFPFLPGDTLLFMSGAFCATGSMDTALVIGLFISAAVLGNTVNFYVGRAVGTRAYTHNYPWLDRAALEKTHAFFEVHGGKTLVLARWLPVVRTFAPFVAGVSNMRVARFQWFNVSGALLWVVALVTAGYFFGNLPVIRDHLNTIVLVGVGAAVLPVLLAAVWRLVQKHLLVKAGSKEPD
jgi:membrane-associated protein